MDYCYYHAEKEGFNEKGEGEHKAKGEEELKQVVKPLRFERNSEVE